MCDESEKANGWKGVTSLDGYLSCSGYLNTIGMTCFASYEYNGNTYTQGWPVNTEPSWWCGEVVGSMCTP